MFRRAKKVFFLAGTVGFARRWGRFCGLMLLIALLCISQPWAMGQTPGSMLHLMEQGQSAFEQGNYHQATQLWEQAQTEAKRRQDLLNQAVVAINLTQTHQQLGQWQQAEAAIATAFSTLNTAPLSRERQHLQAQALNTQGSLYMAQGQLEAALTVWEQAATQYDAVNEVVGQLQSQLNQAQALQTLGFYRRARTLLTPINERLASQPDSGLKATGLRQLGNVLWLMGDFTPAEAAFEQSLTVATAIGSDADRSAALLSQGAMAENRKAYERALQLYQRAQTLGPETLTQLQALVNQHRVAVTTQQWSLAQSIDHNIQQTIPSVPDSQAALFAQLAWSKTLITAEQQRLVAPDRGIPRLVSYPTLAKRLAQLAQAAQALGDVRSHAYALGTLGHLYEQTQQYQPAIQLTEEAIQIAQSLGANEILYQWQWQLGRIHEQQLAQGQDRDAHRQAALTAYGNTLETLKSVRQDLLAIRTDQQFDFRDNVEPVYRQYVDLLLQPVMDQRAPSQRLELALETIDGLRLAELENFLRCNLETREPTQRQLAALDPHAVLIYPILLDQRIELIYQLPGQSLQHHTVAVNRKQINTVVEQLHTSLTQARATDDTQVAAAQLYEWLIQPLRQDLAAAQSPDQPLTLVFVQEPALQNIPMGVLYHQGRYLIEDFAIAVVPSRELLDPSPRSRRLQVLAAGVSAAQQVDGQPYSALPNVETEINGIRSITQSQGSILLNQAFTKRRLRETLNPSKIPVVHIATHGNFSSDPDQTFLLAWGQKLKLQDLDQLLQSQFPGVRTRIELLVLSACETAKGNPRAALGLAGAAVQANVRTTVATLWQVNDRSTAQLMQKFYQVLADQDQPTSIAESLRQAQLALLNDPDDRRPHFWAPFVVVGNWL